jgi:prepilin-type N-terminal cleavage/methylation domain-containing protein
MVMAWARRGFTIVELIITITIMGILLTLAVVNVSTTQKNSRDDGRTTDIASIASNLESYYIAGTDNSSSFQSYPSTSLVGTAANITSYLRDATISSFLPPGTTDVTQTFLASTNTGNSPSIQTTAGVTPQPTANTYVYQPIASDGSVCTGTTQCRKYNLFYYLEGDNSVHKVTSKNQ